MKHRGCVAAWDMRSVARAACAARFRGKMGKGRISTEAFASLLANPGEPIFPETAVAGAGCCISAISRQPDLNPTSTPCSMQTEVEFPTAARACLRVKHRTRTAVESSCIAVQHLTKPLFLSKPVEPPLTALRTAADVGRYAPYSTTNRGS